MPTHLTDAEQLPYTLAIHVGNGANPHCHLMISERGNDNIERSAEQWFKRYNAAEPEAGGARKSTALKPKAWLEETRAAWAEQTNQALQEAGLEIQIDHRSLAAQGIARVPGIHLGLMCWRWKRAASRPSGGSSRSVSARAMSSSNSSESSYERRA